MAEGLTLEEALSLVGEDFMSGDEEKQADAYSKLIAAYCNDNEYTMESGLYGPIIRDKNGKAIAYEDIVQELAGVIYHADLGYMDYRFINSKLFANAAGMLGYDLSYTDEGKGNVLHTFQEALQLARTEEEKALLTDIYKAFDDGKSNMEMVGDKLYAYACRIEDEAIRRRLSQLLKAKKLNSDLRIVEGTSISNYDGNLTESLVDLGNTTHFHEDTHLLESILFEYFGGVVFSENRPKMVYDKFLMEETAKRIAENEGNINEALESLRNSGEQEIIERYGTTMPEFLVDSFLEQHPEVNSTEVSNSKEVAQMLLSSDMSKTRELNSKEYETYMIVSAILSDATMAKSNFGYGHSENYFAEAVMSENKREEELLAEYAELKLTNNEQAIELLRNTAGDNFVDMLEEMYSCFDVDFDVEEVEELRKAMAEG